MKKYHDLRRSALLVILSGLVVLGLVVAMQLQGPLQKPHVFPNKENFTNTMAWIEMALEPREFFDALGPADSEAGKTRRATIDAQNRIDFAFMAAYSLYTLPVFLFLMLLHKRRGTAFFSTNRFFYTGLVLVPIMYVGDLIETQNLFLMTRAAEPAAIPMDALASLILWTRIKWAALFVFLLLVALSYAAYYGPNWRLILPFGLASGALLGLAGLLVPGLRFMVETGSVLLAAGWVSVLVHAFLVFRKSLAKGGTDNPIRIL